MLRNGKREEQALNWLIKVLTLTRGLKFRLKTLIYLTIWTLLEFLVLKFSGKINREVTNICCQTEFSVGVRFFPSLNIVRKYDKLQSASL